MVDFSNLLLYKWVCILLPNHKFWVSFTDTITFWTVSIHVDTLVAVIMAVDPILSISVQTPFMRGIGITHRTDFVLNIFFNSLQTKITVQVLPDMVTLILNLQKFFVSSNCVVRNFSKLFFAIWTGIFSFGSPALDTFKTKFMITLVKSRLIFMINVIKAYRACNQLLFLRKRFSIGLNNLL